MKLTRIEGPATVHHCDGCNRDGIVGSEEYQNASRGEVCQPEEWYRGEDGQYCGGCAAKLVEQDPTRSVNQFFSDTAGNDIRPENLTGLEKVL